MAVLKTILTVVLILISIIITAIILCQEGKSAGLSGSISGMADSYWGKQDLEQLQVHPIPIGASIKTVPWKVS